MKLSEFGMLKICGKRLKTDLLLILSKLNKKNYSGYRRNWV